MIHDEWLDEARAAEIARTVREELARRRMSRQGLADLAKISISTLEKALSGRRAFTLGTVIRLEEALGTSLRSPAAPLEPASLSAPDDLGGYTRSAVRWLEGHYLALRPLFSADGIHAYRLEIEWDAGAARLAFMEHGRADNHAQRGCVSLPHLSGHIYLVTSEAGQYRLAILGRPTAAGSLYGVLTTLLAGHGTQLVPASCPLALLKLGEADAPDLGRIDPDHGAYAGYRAELDAVTGQDFARFPGSIRAG